VKVIIGDKHGDGGVLTGNPQPVPVLLVTDHRNTSVLCIIINS
jgi:hypothetical protein